MYYVTGSLHDTESGVKIIMVIMADTSMVYMSQPYMSQPYMSLAKEHTVLDY